MRPGAVPSTRSTQAVISAISAWCCSTGRPASRIICTNGISTCSIGSRCSTSLAGSPATAPQGRVDLGDPDLEPLLRRSEHAGHDRRTRRRAVGGAARAEWPTSRFRWAAGTDATLGLDRAEELHQAGTDLARRVPFEQMAGAGDDLDRDAARGPRRGGADRA